MSIFTDPPEDEAEVDVIALIIAESMLEQAVEKITVSDLLNMVANSPKGSGKKIDRTCNIMAGILAGITSDRMRKATGANSTTEDGDKRLTRSAMFPDEETGQKKRRQK